MRNSPHAMLPRKAARTIWLLFSCLLAASLCAFTPAHAARGFDIYLTNVEKDGRPQDERMTRFDCSDRIYVVVIAAGLGTGEHELTVRWLDPLGEQRELTRFPFQGSDIANHIWAWLQLNGPTGAIIGQMFDPSFGMEEFIGDWTAEVQINGKVVSEQKFQVLC